MPTREDLAPLVTHVPMSADDAQAIVAALRDVAKVDGVHKDELAMIAGFAKMLYADLGESKPTAPKKMTPAKLAAILLDPTLRTIAVQSAVLLAMADGVISEPERARVLEYARALGMPQDRYEEIERTIVAWVKAGDIGSVL